MSTTEQTATPRTQAQSVTFANALNRALADAMASDESVIMFGEDVGTLGGVFRITDGLTARFGESRCFDTPLAESGIVGMAIGMAMNGMRPVVEMQFDAFAYPAFQQIMSHVAKMSNRTKGAVRLPMVIRVPYAGGIGGVSSATAYAESATGVGEGARTGLASVVTGLAFLASMFLAPVVAMVPYEAATPALVMVGFLMMTQIVDIDFSDVEKAIPAFLTIILMPFAYSITVGIGAGFVTYVLIRIVRGRAREVHWLLYVVALLFVAYFLRGAIEHLIV